MEISWGQAVVFLVAFIVLVSFVGATLEEAAAQDKRERERRECQALQRRKGAK
jgi:hypothetical protein